MRHSRLTLALIALNGCAHLHGAPAAPAMQRCVNLADHFRCLSAEGKSFSDPYPGKEPMMCIPVHDWEARRDWEDLLK